MSNLKILIAGLGFVLGSSAHAYGFVCAGGDLVGSEGAYVHMGSPASCQAAVRNAQGGFVCVDSTLIGTVDGFGATFSDAKTCLDTLRSANEGFVCVGSSLYGSAGESAYMANAKSCQAAVNLAKAGFTCMDNYLVGARNGVGVEMASVADCQAAVQAGK